MTRLLTVCMSDIASGQMLMLDTVVLALMKVCALLDGVEERETAVDARLFRCVLSLAAC